MVTPFLSTADTSPYCRSEPIKRFYTSILDKRIVDYTEVITCVQAVSMDAAVTCPPCIRFLLYRRILTAPNITSVLSIAAFWTSRPLLWEFYSDLESLEQ